MNHLSYFQWLHLILALMTVIFTLLAGGWALRLVYQDYSLRNMSMSPVHNELSNLESMEHRLFQWVAAGFAGLTSLILSGVYMFYTTQPIIWLKLSVTLIAWAIFGGLLWLRYQYGLRGRVAIVTTLLGVVIVLALFVYSSR